MCKSINLFIFLSFCIINVKSQLNLPEGSKCQANGKEGRCVLYKRCLSVILDRDAKRKPEICSYNQNRPVTCCTDCDLVEDIDKIVIDPQVGYRYKDGSKAWDYCLDSFQRLPYLCKKHFSYKLYRNWNESRQCHDIQYTAVGASGGKDAERGEFPHMALLGYGEESQGMQWLCGGSVISQRFILTAAHCSSSTTAGPLTYAALGILKRTDPEELWQKYKIQEVILHPGYKPPSKYNDIALLRTEKRIKFSIDVMPACLHTRQTLRIEQTWASAMGWGAISRRGPLADTLQKVTIHKFSHEECSNLYQPHRHLLSGYDNKTQMCYGDKVDIQDTCGGDSGGPLITSSGCMSDIAGVTSYGRACGIAGQAGMYTRVKYYVPWIESIVWPDN